MIARLPDDVRFPISKPSLYLLHEGAGKGLGGYRAGARSRPPDSIFPPRGARREGARGNIGPRELAWVGYLTRDQVSEACKKLDDVQRYTDKAVAKVRGDAEYTGPADFGTKVHKEIENTINKFDDPKFIAERSFSKAKAESEAEAEAEAGPEGKERVAKYGAKDTVRVDALENRPEFRMACVYDPKTGRRGLSSTRMSELASAVWHRFRSLRLIVIEVRPTQK